MTRVAGTFKFLPCKPTFRDSLDKLSSHFSWRLRCVGCCKRWTNVLVVKSKSFSFGSKICFAMHELLFSRRQPLTWVLRLELSKIISDKFHFPHTFASHPQLKNFSKKPEMENLIFYNSTCSRLDNFVSVIKECNYHEIPFVRVSELHLGWLRRKGRHQKTFRYGRNLCIFFRRKFWVWCKISIHAAGSSERLRGAEVDGVNCEMSN